MELHIIRHTPVNLANGICYGQTDVDVSDSFLTDAKVLKTKLDTDYDMVYSSPLQRCTKLGFELGFTDLQLDHRLKEYDFGDWELQKWNAIDENALREWSDNFEEKAAPNGESLQELFHRVASFYHELKTSDHKKALIITHSGVIRCIWALILEIPLNNSFKIPVGFGENFVVDTTYNLIKNKG